MKYKLTERCWRVRELYRIAMWWRHIAILARNNPLASAGDMAEAEVAARLAAGVCDRELQELVRDIDEGMRGDGIAPGDSYAFHRLAVSLAFAGTECCGNCDSAYGRAHN